MNPSLNDMAYFSAVVQYRGFTAAANALGISKSLLSRRVGELEACLGIRLLNRTSRQFSVTELGEQYAAQCRKMLEEADRAQHLIDQSHEKPSGTLSISAPVTMTETFLAPMVAEFMELYPDVRIDLLAINRDVDPIEEGVDIVIRSKLLPLEDSSLHFRALIRHRDQLVASPALIEKHRELFDSSVQNLSMLPILSRKENTRQHIWLLEHPELGRKKIPVTPRLFSNNLIVHFHAALAGLGVAQLPPDFCQSALAHGELQRVFPEWQSPEMLLHMVFASNKGRASAITVFIDYFAQYFADPERLLEKLRHQTAKYLYPP